MKKLRGLRHLGEYALLRPLLGLFALLPIDYASALGGALLRALGPRLKYSRHARVNLAHVFPAHSAAEREAMLVGMWDNLGRILAEYPHLGRLSHPANDRIVIVGAEHMDALRGNTGLCISGHIGNWEVLSCVATRRELSIVQIYRRLNNPMLDRLLGRYRAEAGGRMFPKGPAAARAAARSLHNGEQAGMLADQKLNEGLLLPFFGRGAMTSTLPARLALHFSAPVVLMRAERLRGARFRVTVLPPLSPPDTGNREIDIARFTRAINAVLEEWIRDRPQQWLWIHRRWPPEFYLNAAASDRQPAPDQGVSDTN